jgi:ABC-2 type transport system ATP-binding protein
MNDFTLKTQDLCKTFGKKAVLNGASLQVPRGSVTGLLGSNGAGKTTLIRCLLGLAKPSAGSATVCGEESWDLSAQVKSRLGYVPQTPAHYAWMRVRDLIAYVGAFYPTWDQALADRLRQQWDIAEDARCGKLSPGEAQRLALVLALSHRPEILVLDEPAASLDPVGRRQFLAAVLEATAEGVTVLLSTHLCADLERVADRIAVLKDGKISLQANIDALKEHVKRLRIINPRCWPQEIPIEGLLSRKDCEGGSILVVQDKAAETRQQLERDYGATVEIDDLGLEDIAVEVLK